MKGNNKNKIFVVLTVLILVNLACGTINRNNFETAAEETVEVKLTEIAVQNQDLDMGENPFTETSLPEPITVLTNTPVPTETIISTATTIPTETSVPTSTAIPSLTPTATEVIPCDVAVFITDVTVPDGSDFSPGQNFTKTWRLKNVGSCTWTTAYDLVFYDGEQMGGPVSQPLIPSGSVDPNQSVDVSVDLSAPGVGGNYTGFWKLRNASNVVFELTNGNPFYVEIDVIEPTATPFVPIFIPIIPPLIIISPDFTASYSDVWNCFLSKRSSFQINNTGSFIIESVIITVEGPIGADIAESTTNYPFYNSPSKTFPSCTNIGNSSLLAGETAWIYVPMMSEPLPGITGRVTIKVCTLDDLGGFCKEKSFEFIW